MSDLLIANPAGFVPPHATMFGAIGGMPVPVTPETPLPVAVTAQATASGLIERLNREGEPVSSFADVAYTSFAAPGGAGVPGPQAITAPAVGRALFVQQIAMWSTTPVAGRVQIGLSNWSGIGTPFLMDIGYAAGPSLAASIPVNAFVRSSDKPVLGSFVRRWYDPAATGTHYVGAGATAWTLADAINFDARKVILFLGDSLWNGTGPSSVATCIPWLVNAFYREGGIDCRYILKAYSGSTTATHELFRSGGRYEYEKVDAIFYNLGINDAVQGIATAASIANIRTLAAWKQRRYPRARLVILGPTPVQAAATESALAALRAGQQAMVASLNDPAIQFCDLGRGFDRGVATNYVASDGADGTRIHPADPALQQQWAGGYDMPGLRAWLAANLPAI